MFRANRYPKDWPRIRAEIRARAGERCECTGQCGDARRRRAGARAGCAVAELPIFEEPAALEDCSCTD